MLLTEEMENLLRDIQDSVEEWENASTTEQEEDGFDGCHLDGILEDAKNSGIFAGFEIYDILMKIDGEDKTDGELISLSGDLVNAMLREKLYWKMVEDLDFRQSGEEWANRYDPVQGDEGDMSFETFFPYVDEAKELAAKFAEEQGTNICQHIWTVVDADSDEEDKDDIGLIVLNGWHAVNRIHYVVCKNPWGNGNKVDSNINIEAKY